MLRDADSGGETRRRRDLAELVVEAVRARTPIVAALVVGSAARGDADLHSDVDVALWSEEEPEGEPVRDALLALGAERRAGDRALVLKGVRIDAGLQTVGRVEEVVERVLSAADPGEPMTKAVIGIRGAVPLVGAALVQSIRTRTDDYPDALARGLVTANLDVYPIWREQRHLAARDARLFQTQALLDGAFAVLGMLSGLNRVYFTRYQLTRMRGHVEALRLAPPGLAQRLDSLFDLDLSGAAAELARLLDESLSLIEPEMPGVDTSALRAALGERSL